MFVSRPTYIHDVTMGCHVSVRGRKMGREKSRGIILGEKSEGEYAREEMS